MASNTLRMSGLNSGLDTEAIVNALTAATKNKINKNQRSILKLQAQQEAYRSIIDKFNAFKDKYLDILNVGTCLKSKTMFNSFKSTLTSSTGTNYVPGVTVSSSTNANTGTYDVTVNKVATQATRKSSTDTGKEFSYEGLESGREYTMKVTVGSNTQTITFKAGDTDDQTRDNINEVLKEKFGVTNNGTGLVSLGSDNKFTSTDKSAISYTSPTIYTNQRSADLSNVESGTNSFTITVNGVEKVVSFSTLSEDYFDDLFERDENGNLTNTLKSEEDIAADSELATKYAVYKQVVLNQRDGEVYEAYDKWWNGYEDENGEWVDGLSDADKKVFAEKVAKEKYQAALDDIDSDYEKAREAKAQLAAYNEYLEEYNSTEHAEDEEALSFNDYIEEHPLAAEDYEVFDETKEGQELIEQRDEAKEKLLKTYLGYTDKVVEKEVNAAYNEQFEAAKAAAKQAAYDAAIADGTIQNTDEEAENYVASVDDFEFTYTKADFAAVDEDGEHNEYYQAYETAREEIEDHYLAPDTFSVDLDSMSDSQRMALYDEFFSADEKGVVDEDEYVRNYADHMDQENAVSAAREAVYQFNKANIENNLGNIQFGTLGGVGFDVEYTRDGQLTITAKSITLGDAFTPQFAITANANSKNDFGFDTTDVTGTASQVSTTSTLAELDLEPDANGNYSFSINGVSFSFTGDTTISDMMKQINASTAGVKMSYTTLTNQFIITANEYGTGVEINLSDNNGVLAALGFTGGDEEFTEGTNTELVINGVEVETTSNSYTVDGTTFTFTQAAVGQTFTNEVARDYSKAIDTIKSFVQDYNELIDFIYGYVDDEPNSDYYFLTDDDIEEMDLSDSQQNKWETMAKKGLLYRDSTLTDIMSKLRTVLYNSVDAADGTKVGLYTLGITTSSDYSNHGKLVFDETKDFEALFEKYADEITTLFTDSEKGIAYQFETIINNAVRTTGAAGERGTLVDKAGVSGTASATSNTIYNKIKSLQDMIATLQARYEQQQDRYWKIYSNMETMLGNLNSQTSYINQLLGSY